MMNEIFYVQKKFKKIFLAFIKVKQNLIFLKKRSETQI